ncbi:MAG TPA: hypothetical protein H9858_00530 [Candidatus Blautia stercoravium]|nr:hypothetical protein [Candidatus Blautia stercoravium]
MKSIWSKTWNRKKSSALDSDIQADAEEYKRIICEECIACVDRSRITKWDVNCHGIRYE